MEEDLTFLRSLCDDSAPREQRIKLVKTRAASSFSSPEHQIVFESIRALLSSGPVTTERLGIHLTKRGFPDIDAHDYCAEGNPKF